MEEGQHDFRFDAAQVETLAARQDRDGHLADFGGGEDEFHMGGGFFKGLQQGVEGGGAEHMHFVKNEDLVARGSGTVGHAFNDRIADVLDAGLAGGVHLHHIDMAAFGNGAAGLALAAGLGRRASLAIGTGAVQALGDDPGGGGFAGAANAGEDEGMGDAVGGKGIFQGAHHRLLPDEIGKGFGAVFAGKDAVGLVGVGHSHSRDSV